MLSAALKRENYFFVYNQLNLFIILNILHHEAKWCAGTPTFKKVRHTYATNVKS